MHYLVPLCCNFHELVPAPTHTMITHYTVLGVEENATAALIKAAHRKKALKVRMNGWMNE